MISTLAAFAAIGATLEALAWLVYIAASRLNRRRFGVAVAAVLGIVGGPFVAFAGYMAAFLALGQPEPLVRRLGDGVRYRRVVLQAPRRIVAHVLEVDLSKGVRIVVSPPSDGTLAEAVTPATALERLQADVVVNANYFYPFRESTPFDFSPHEGDLVQALGEAIGDGERYGKSNEKEEWIAFWSEPVGGAGFGEPPPEADAAVAGAGWLVRQGKPAVDREDEPYPRTAVGLDEDRRRLWLVVVDGKQPRYSEGMSLRELAALFISLGSADAIHLDGGGSAAMAARDERDRPALLSRPCHTKIPGRPRPVANFLGLVFRTQPR